MIRKTFSLHNVLPPEELRAKLDRKVQAHNNQERGRCYLILRWKSENRFTLFMMEYEDFVGVEREGAMRSVKRGRGASYSPILCGEISPDGEGSVIVGHFRQLLTRWLLCVIAAGCLIGFAATGQWLACLLTAALGGWFFYSLLTPQRGRSGETLWAKLEFLAATIDNYADG